MQIKTNFLMLFLFSPNRLFPSPVILVRFEALALRLGLSWALDVKLPFHLVESNVKTVVQALVKRSIFRNKFGSILSDVSNLLSNF